MEVRPTLEEFLALARDHDVVPMVRELTSDTVTPFTVYSRLARGGRNPFLLESVEGGEHVARYSFAGVDPFRIVEIRDGEVLVDGVPEAGPPIEVLRRVTDLGRVAPVDDLPPFCGGAMGYLGYDAVRLVEAIPASGRDEGGLPDAWFGLYDSVVALDRARQRLQLVALARIDDDPEAAWSTALQRIDNLHAALLAGGDGPMPHTLPVPKGDVWSGWQSTPSADDYLAAVATAREHILAGDIFQVVLSRRWRRVPRCTAAEIYRMLRVTNPSPYMFLFDTGNARILGSSPEMLVRVEGRTVSTCPIAGTRPAARDRDEDLRLEAELLADPKERAEHTMLVDLGRNDIGRVAVPGTVGWRARPRSSATATSCTWSARSRANSARVRRLGRALRLFPGRDAERGAQGAGDGDHRRARGGSAWGLRRGGGLSQRHRRSRLVHRHPDPGRARRYRPAPGRRRDRLRLGARERARRVSQQGQRLVEAVAMAEAALMK